MPPKKPKAIPEFRHGLWGALERRGERANNAKLNKEQKVKDNVRLTYLMYVLGDSYLEMHRSEKRYGRFFEGAKIIE